MGELEEPCIYESPAHDDIIRKTSHTVGWTTKLRNMQPKANNYG